jgi:hypothetical protein
MLRPACETGNDDPALVVHGGGADCIRRANAKAKGADRPHNNSNGGCALSCAACCLAWHDRRRTHQLRDADDGDPTFIAYGDDGGVARRANAGVSDVHRPCNDLMWRCALSHAASCEALHDGGGSTSMRRRTRRVRCTRRRGWWCPARRCEAWPSPRTTRRASWQRWQRPPPSGRCSCVHMKKVK